MRRCHKYQRDHFFPSVLRVQRVRAAAESPGPAALHGFTFHRTEGHVSLPYGDLKPDSLAKFGKKRSPLRAQEPSCSLELFPPRVRLDKSSARVEHTHTHYMRSRNPGEHNSNHLQGFLMGKVKHVNPKHFKKKIKSRKHTDVF